MGLMVALLPYGVDAEDIAHPDGLPIDELHVTSRYYGHPDDDFVEDLRERVMAVAAEHAPFVADIVSHGTLGKESPPATVLHLASPNGEFEDIHEALPDPPEDSDAKSYPGYRPHLTLGYGVPEDHAESIDDTVGIKFDRIAVANNGDWFVASLTGDSRPDDDSMPGLDDGDDHEGIVAAIPTDCPHCGPDADTEMVSEADHGGGYRMRCNDCGHEWDDPNMSHGARTAAAKKGKKGKNPFALFKKTKAKTPSFTKKQRDAMAESGEAMSDGSFPIRDGHGEQDLANAVQAIGRAKDRSAAEAHIRKRAKALDMEDKLPFWIGKPARKAGLTPGWGYITDNDVHVHMRRLARTAAADPRMKGGGKHQKCFHGSKATCKSVRWIAAYTAMRERRGFSKKKAAMIANAMQRAWEEGRPWGAPGRKGLIKKRHTV